MIYYDVAHSSPEWFKIRIGIATASNFDKILTPTGKPSAQADDLANRLIAEMILGESLDKFPANYWMERGALMENEARQSYEIITDLTLDRGGFMTTDSGIFGASPDVRVFEDGKLMGAAEIKCPAPWTHVENLLRHGGKIDPKYVPQVQGQLFVSGLKWIDWFSYHPGMPPALIRVEPDQDYQDLMAEAFEKFEGIMQIKFDTLAERGVIVKRPNPHDAFAKIEPSTYMAG